MTPRSTRRLLWSAAGFFAAAAAVTLVCAAALPYEASSSIARATSRPATLPAPAVADLPSLEEFAPIWELHLRGPLTGEARPATDAATTQPVADQSGGTIRLIGTIIEAGRSYALLMNGNGQLQFKAVGDELDGAKVQEIRDDAVTLQNATGETVVLSLPKPQP